MGDANKNGASSKRKNDDKITKSVSFLVYTWQSVVIKTGRKL